MYFVSCLNLTFHLVHTVYRNQLPDPELGGYIGLGSTPPARRQLDGARTATNQTAAAWESVTVTSQIGGHRVIANSGQL